MDEETLKAVSLKYPEAGFIIFHGGEPTLMGVKYLERAIEILGERIFLLQTNLIDLDLALIDLLKEHFGSSVGTSLDTSRLPYMERILGNVSIFKSGGIKVHAILTVTSDLTIESALSLVKRFSDSGGSSFSLQFATPVKTDPVEPSHYMEMFMKLSSHPLNNTRKKVLGALCGNLPGGVNGGNCARWVRTIEPDGTLYVCPDFAGQGMLEVGNVLSGGEDINSPGLMLFREREKRLSLSCSEECWPVCRGGCLGLTTFWGKAFEERDPYCEVYREIFRRLRDGE
jgi:radical SAM protein with 4Fe4S-binding SPASM domain